MSTIQATPEVEQKMHEMIEAWRATWGNEPSTPETKAAQARYYKYTVVKNGRETFDYANKDGVKCFDVILRYGGNRSDGIVFDNNFHEKTREDALVSAVTDVNGNVEPELQTLADSGVWTLLQVWYYPVDHTNDDPDVTNYDLKEAIALAQARKQ